MNELLVLDLDDEAFDPFEHTVIRPALSRRRALLPPPLCYRPARDSRMTTPKAPITSLLYAWRQGDERALERLTPLIYDELHRLAASYMRRERKDHTLNPTALVSEAFLRLVGAEALELTGRAQFFAIAATHMRRILVDHARRRASGKRGGQARPVTFDEALALDERPDALVALDDALVALASFDARKARAVELHYFGGMEHKEIALALSVSETTVGRDLRMAEAWLNRHLTSGD